MKAISIHQPWASFIECGLKDLENRPRLTHIRGWVLMHASKAYDDTAFPFVFAALKKPLHPLLRARFLHAKRIASLGRLSYAYKAGGIIGAMRIDDCITASSNPWFIGPYAYVIGARVQLPFFPCAGKQGWFNVDLPPEMEALIPKP